MRYTLPFTTSSISPEPVIFMAYSPLHPWSGVGCCGRSRTACHCRMKDGMILEAPFTAATARSVCGSSPRNGCFRSYHTNTARGDRKPPFSEIGGIRGERLRIRLDAQIESRCKNGGLAGVLLFQRKRRDVLIQESPNPEIIGSNPVPTAINFSSDRCVTTTMNSILSMEVQRR